MIKQDITQFAKHLIRLSKLPIRYLGDPQLHHKCKPILTSKITAKETQDFANKLKETLIEYRKITGVGRGLAANQIGGTLRMSAVWPFGVKEPEIIINPKVVWKSKEKATYHEMCMSLVLVGIDVIRPYIVTVAYYDLLGRKQQKKLDPQTSRLIQHEIDHLDGILCLEKGNLKSTSIIFNSQAKILAQKFALKKLI